MIFQTLLHWYQFLVRIYQAFFYQSNGTQYAAEKDLMLPKECNMYGTGQTVYCVQNNNNNNYINNKENRGYSLIPQTGIDGTIQLTLDFNNYFIFENDLFVTSVCCLENGQIAVCVVNGHSYNPSRSFVRVCFKTHRFQGIQFSQYFKPTSSGQVPKDIEFYQEERLFRYPRRIAHNSNRFRDLWVVNRLNEHTGNIVVIDLEGKLKFRYNRNTDNLSFDPMDVAANKNGSMIIADFGNHLIHLVKDDGTFLQYIMTREHGLAFPSAVALDQSDRAWIGCDFGKVHIVRFNKRFK